MAAGPTQHYGSHDFALGELRNWRAHIFATVAAANAQSANAQARLIYIIETQTMYFGRPGAWVALAVAGGGTGSGSAIDTVSDPNDLEVEYTSFALTVLDADDGTDTFTFDDPLNDLEDVAAGDELTISGSEDSGAAPWLDGVYTVVSVDTGTDTVVVATGSIPAVPTPPAVNFGSAQFVDLTFPAAGSIAIVEPDPDPLIDGPAIYVYDSVDAVWARHNDVDGRLVFIDGSRAFLALPTTTVVDNPTDDQELVRYGLVLNLLNGVLTGAHSLVDIDSGGVNTVVTFLSDDAYAFVAGDLLRLSGAPGGLDGDHPILAVTVTPGAPDTFEVEIANAAVTDPAPTGVGSILRPSAAYPTSADLAVYDAHLVDTANPHGVTAVQVGADPVGTAAAAVAAHEAAGNPHPVYTTDSEAEAIAQTEVNDHDSLAGAHQGRISALELSVFGSSGLMDLDGVLLTNQVVDETAAWAEPVYRDPDTLKWLIRSGADDPVHGLAINVSTLRTPYEAVDDVDFTVTGITIPAVIRDQFSTGMVLRFPGAATNTGDFRIQYLDEVTGEFVTSPLPAAEADVVTDITIVESIGSVIHSGILPIRSGRTKVPATDVLRYDIDLSQIKLDDGPTLDHVTAGDEVVIAGSTDNDTTVIVESVSDRTIQLKRVRASVTLGLLVQSITVASSTVVFDAGDDLTVVLPGHEIELAGTTDNDGIFTVDTVDDGTKTITLVEPMAGTDQAGAAGTGDVYDLQASALPGTQLPVVQTFVNADTIDAIDVDNGGGQAEVTFDAGTDLSLVLAGDILEISGATDPDNDGFFLIDAADNGTKIVTLSTTLVGADQVAPGGTGTITGEREVADGTALIRVPQATNNYDSVVTVPGKKFFADHNDAEGYSLAGRYKVSEQIDSDNALVDIADEYSGVTDLVDGANIATDASLGRVFEVTLAGNRQLDNPTNIAPGMVITWYVIQDGAGGHTLTLDTNFATEGGGGITLSAAAGAVDILTGIVRSDGSTVDLTIGNDFS